ncbi:MAG: flagellar hook-length control protein FliK, partial [Clostridiales bacterium]|nr:flagellar hook-length control protein FliK [Clostridiales bacterium]
MINIVGTEGTKPESTKPVPDGAAPGGANYESAGGNAEDMQIEQAKMMIAPRSPLSGHGQYIEGRFWGDIVINIVGIEGTGAIPDVAGPGGANYEGAGGNVEGTQVAQAKGAQVAKSLVDLLPGQVFSAEILDIQPGVIHLKMGEGAPLAARTLSPPDARIGDNATFVVRENVPGQGNAPAQITLEFLRGAAIGENARVSASIVKEALAAANMQYTGQNSALIEDLVAHNLPIDHNSVQRAAFFRYSMPDVPFARIAFLMENNFAPIERTVEVFQRMAAGEMNLRSETANLQRLVAETNFQNPAVRENLQAMISGKLIFEPQAQPQTQPQVEAQAQSQAQAPQPGQSIELQNSQITDLGKYLTQLRTLTEEITAFLRQNGENSPAIRQSLENIGDMLDFARNIGETKMYYQFPFVLAGREHLAELHIFKKKAARKTSGKNATALIGLDMAHLGRVEILVNKAGRDVNLQFRTDSGRTIMLVGENRAKLADMLGDAGYLLTGLGMKMIDEKFDIASGERKEAPRNTPSVG